MNDDDKRASLHYALQRHLDRHVDFTAAFMASFLVRVLSIELLTELVDGLDTARPVGWTVTGSSPGVENR